MAALNVEAFVPIADFKDEVERLVTEIKSSPTMSGFNEVLLPGEREHKTMEMRRKEGIPIDDRSWQDIVEKCRELGIDARRIMQ